jgi:hypothetical protein
MTSFTEPVNRFQPTRHSSMRTSFKDKVYFNASRYREKATGWPFGISFSRRGKRYFTFSKWSKPALRLAQPLALWIAGALTPGESTRW